MALSTTDEHLAAAEVQPTPFDPSNPTAAPWATAVDELPPPSDPVNAAPPPA
ncbi:hypothetical protein [Streptomyces sp. JNUCC 63]